MVKYGDLNPRCRGDPSSVQRLVRASIWTTGCSWHAYEVPIEGQRHRIKHIGRTFWTAKTPCASELGAVDNAADHRRFVVEHLARVADFRSGVQWLSVGPPGPTLRVSPESARMVPGTRSRPARRDSNASRKAEAAVAQIPPSAGSVWTYVTTTSRSVMDRKTDTRPRAGSSRPGRTGPCSSWSQVVRPTTAVILPP